MEREIYIDNTKETALSISASTIESIKVRDITKKGVRIYEDGFMGVAGAAGEIDEDELAALAKDNKDFIFSNKILMLGGSTTLKNTKGLNLKYKDRFIAPDSQAYSVKT